MEAVPAVSQATIIPLAPFTVLIVLFVMLRLLMFVPVIRSDIYGGAAGLGYCGQSIVINYNSRLAGIKPGQACRIRPKVLPLNDVLASSS